MNDRSTRLWGHRRGLVLRGLCGALALAAVPAGGAMMMALAPEPAPVPTRWQLEVEVGPLRLMTVDDAKAGKRTYAYLTYRVVNNSGDDVLFAPSFEMADGEGNLQRSGRDVPQSVTTAIMESTQNPLIEDQISIIGEIAQGKENGKDGVVIWPLLDMNPQEMVVYAGGFSGETATVEGKDSEGKPTKFTLRKTLRLEYTVPGTLEGRRAEPIPLASQSWIMR